MSELGLGQGFGVELEYMVVDIESLDIRPVVDQLIELEVGSIVNEVEGRDIGWSNELALHVLELKNLDPTFPFERLISGFNSEIEKINQHLQKHLNCQLLPSAMHPWMIPEKESRLWPHGNRQIYEKFHEVFGCSGHGWTNLQSVHMNFSFATNDEFRRLHRAVRLILPLIPAFSASSPFWEGRRGPDFDTRLYVYLNNQTRIPEIMGAAIPDDVSSINEYKEHVLEPMYRAISPYDPKGILQHEWLNSRAAIPKFNYGCLEVRLMDIQECPEQDISLVWFFRNLVNQLLSQTWTSEQEQAAIDSYLLKDLLETAATSASRAVFKSHQWLSQFGIDAEILSARELGQELLGRIGGSESEAVFSKGVGEILRSGTLAERLVRVTGSLVSPVTLRPIYQKLAECLRNGTRFDA
ncbi:MAG: glutamate--cysteine ligase [Bdellovibrionales bacterium]|nr:glutamate--cysteine ligase [Bdellovibrionales bacterium]